MKLEVLHLDTGAIGLFWLQVETLYAHLLQFVKNNLDYADSHLLDWNECYDWVQRRVSKI